MLEQRCLGQRSIAAVISVVAQVDYDTLSDVPHTRSPDEKSDLEIAIDEAIETVHNDNSVMDTDYSLTVAGLENMHFYGEQENIYYDTASNENDATKFQAYEVQAETMTPPELEETFVDMQYAAIAGAWTEMNFRDRRRFALSIIFDRALFNLYELDRGVTREVNYTMH